MNIDTYNLIGAGRAGFYEQKRGLIAVWGKEAVQFLDGLVTNSVKGLEDGGQMLAAFPDAKGRLIAVVRVLRHDDLFLFETEIATREAVHQKLFRFTAAGDFFVEDRSDDFVYFEMFGPVEDVYHADVGERIDSALAFELPYGAGYFIQDDWADGFRSFLVDENNCLAIDDELYETLRIESGIPKYGIDMDETTVVPELGLDGLVSYNKGCYIGQEIIARIHFRGHVAKQLIGILSEPSAAAGGLMPDTELMTSDGKPAGKISSVTFSPKLNKAIALAYIRYDFLAPGTELVAGGTKAVVTELPFIK